MYRCGICGACSPAKQPRYLHVVYRDTPTGPQIAREIPVCLDHRRALDRGRGYDDLRDEAVASFFPDPAPEPEPIPVAEPDSPVVLNQPIVLGRPVEVARVPRPVPNKRRK